MTSSFTLPSLLGTQRLVVMCEVEMSKELQRQTDDNIADLAPQLLMLADEAGLTNLRNAALDYVGRPSYTFPIPSQLTRDTPASRR